MSKPFKIFPSIGYKNTQFQIVSKIDNLKIIFNKNDKTEKTIVVNSDSPTLLTKLNKTGIYIVKCNHDGKEYNQQLEIRDALRLGDSEFKTAYVFEDIDLSIYLMKDRILIYNETTKLLLTENHLSPGEIQLVNKDNLLFITKIGQKANGITNFGLYNLNEYEIIGELINKYKEIKILRNNNRLWVKELISNNIVCFEIVDDSLNTFTELKRISEYINYQTKYQSTHMYVEFDNEIQIINMVSLEEKAIKKNPNIAISKDGWIYEINDGYIYFRSILSDDDSKFIEKVNHLNLKSDNFIFLGKDYKNEIIKPDYSDIVTTIKKNKLSEISTNPETKEFNVLLEKVLEFKYVTHKVFVSVSGVYLLTIQTTSKFESVAFNNYFGPWVASPNINDTNTYSLDYINKESKYHLIIHATSFSLEDNNQNALIIRSNNKLFLINGENLKEFNHHSSLTIIRAGKYNYLLEKKSDLFSLFSLSSLDDPKLSNVEIINYNPLYKHSLIEEYQSIWYFDSLDNDESAPRYINCFLLNDSLKVKEIHSQYNTDKNSSGYNCRDNYIETNNKELIHPRNVSLKNAVLGNIISTTPNLDKVVTRRDSQIYLSKFDILMGKYIEEEILIEEDGFKESYLSPNGKFLILQNKINKYLLYNIAKGEFNKFDSGKFLAFSKEGNLIIEKSNSRAVKIIDPVTFEDITPPNYHHYRFTSPDGNLYAQTAIKSRFIDLILEIEIDWATYNKIKKQLDFPITQEIIAADKKKLIMENVLNKREEIYNTHTKRLNELGINRFEDVTSAMVVKLEKYTEIGVVSSDKTCEILFPVDLDFYNYSAFSYDNMFFGYVGKPFSRGFINLFKINYNSTSGDLSLVNSYESRLPKMASWVCGFSQTGYFATYDSIPDTYITKCDDQLFEDDTEEKELNNDPLSIEESFYEFHNNWNIIRGKNFLCFSPTGNFLALSESGYDPLTLGGYGHQESNTVHIANTETGKILDSFIGHGSKIKTDKRKKVTFVAFSDDEKDLMTMSDDGVVIIRKVNIINDGKSDEKNY